MADDEREPDGPLKPRRCAGPERSSGTIGCALRAWAATKAASAATATAKAASTFGAPKPTAPASIAPYVSPLIAITAVI